MKNILISLFTLILILFVSAASTNAEDAHKKRKAFTCLVWHDLPIKELFYNIKKEYKPLEFRRNKRSKSYPLDNGATFNIYQSVISDTGDQIYQTVGMVDIPSNINRPLFIIEPNKNKASEGLPLNILVVDDSEESFPAGSFKFMNFSNQNLLIKIGKEVLMLPKSEFKAIDSQAPEQGGLIPIKFGNTKGEKLHFTRIYGHKNSREMIFIRQSDNPQKVIDLTYVTQNLPSQ